MGASLANKFQSLKSSGAVQIVDAGSEKQIFDAEIYRMFRSMVEDNKRLLTLGYILCVAWSKGKDSSVVLLGALEAIKEFRQEAPDADMSQIPLVITTIDTGVENTWIQLHGMYEEQRLESYCKEQGIHLEMRRATPPLAERWASLFISLQKLPSVGRLKNDCSSILKIDQSARVLRTINGLYSADKLVTLIGSRFEESAARAHSIKKHGNDVSVEQVIVNGQASNVFMPIRHWTFEQVMGLLSRAGTHPIVEPSPGFEIPAYGKNFRVLKTIYGDADSGACPVSAHQVKGANQQGGCGQSRFGCYLCLKVPKDNSVENQNKKVRYSYLQGNLKKIRDYIYLVSQDLRHRTYHSRAIDFEMGYVVLQPNVLKAETTERIALYLMQASVDDGLRAKAFKQLVARSLTEGEEVLMQDPGYADIMTDPELSEDDKNELASVYVIGAQKQLVNAIDLEGALYLDAMHSRDGARLPPFRMTWLYQQVIKGYRLPYPNVDVKNARVDEIPDAKMLPIKHLSMTQLFREAELWELDSRNGCFSTLRDTSQRHTLKLKRSQDKDKFSLVAAGKAVIFHPELHEALASQKATLQAELGDNQSGEASMTVELRSREYYALPKQVSTSPVQAKRHKTWSRRSASIKKIKGQHKVIKGRASVQFYKFNDESRLSRAHMKTKSFWLPSWVQSELPVYHDVSESSVFEDQDFTVGYAIDPDSLAEWEQWDGLDRAMAKHDEYIARAKNHKHSRFRYAGTSVFEHLLSAGVLLLNEGTAATSQRIVARTNLFNSVGLFNMPDDAKLMKFGVTMSQYRSDKAKRIQALRKAKSADRKNTLEALALLQSTPSDVISQVFKEGMSALTKHYGGIYSDWLKYKVGAEMGLTGFDDVSYRNREQVSLLWLREVDDLLSDPEKAMALLLTQENRQHIDTDWKGLQAVKTQLDDQRANVATIKVEAMEALKESLTGEDYAGEYWFWSIQNEYQRDGRQQRKADEAMATIAASTKALSHTGLSMKKRGRSVTMAHAFLAQHMG